MDRTVTTSLGEVEVLEALRVRAQDLYPEVVARYVEALERGDRLPDLVVARMRERLLLIDGRHRIAAWEAAGVPIVARVGWWIHDIGEALEMAMQANARHGEPRRLGDVARCIERALEVWGGESDREIARRVGCSPTSVGAQRARARQLSGEVEVSSLDTSKLPEGSTWRSPWTPKSFQVVDEPWDGVQIDGTQEQSAALVIGVDHGSEPPAQVAAVAVPQDISFADRMTELWGEEPEAEQEQTPASKAAWVEDVDRELARMGPGRVLLASGEAEVPVAREVRRHRGQDPLERWYTDPALATVCWRWLLESGLLKDVMPTCAGAQLRCLEPCVGGGAWVAGLEAASRGLGGDPSRASWVVMDADPEAPGLRLWKERVAEAVVGDFLTTPWEGWKFDVVISNPPNSRAQKVVEESIRRLDWHGVAAFLLPASWMAAKKRRGWLSLNPPRVVALVPWRPSFEGPAAELQGTGEGSPTQDYALHVWVNGDPPGRSWTGTWMDDSSEVGDGEE